MRKFTKLISTIGFIAVAVYGSICLGAVSMPDLHEYCGAWG